MPLNKETKYFKFCMISCNYGFENGKQIRYFVKKKSQSKTDYYPITCYIKMTYGHYMKYGEVEDSLMKISEVYWLILNQP